MSQRVAIAGGGLKAWMAAAWLARRLEGLRPAIAVIGDDIVDGEGVCGPAVHRFNAAIGLDTARFVSETGAVPYLGLQQDGWFWPCGGFGVDLDGIAFHHHWLRLLTLGGHPDPGRFSLEATAARDGRFGGAPGRPLTYGFRFDAARYRTLLQQVAMEAGVKHGPAGEADLTIDCRGALADGDAWTGRTLSLGAVESPLPTLDQTIHALERLVALWPRADIVPTAVACFNADMAIVQGEVRDITAAHRALSGHDQAMSDSLAARLDLFQATGEILSAPGPVRASDWLALFVGLGLRPRAWHPVADLLPEDELKRRLAKVRTHIQDTVNALPIFGG